MDNGSNSIQVVIAHDHPIFRDGLLELLETDPEINVVGEAANGREAIELARGLKPDILLLDATMPGTDGTHVLRELSADCGSVRTLLLTAAADNVETVKARVPAAHDRFPLYENAPQQRAEGSRRLRAICHDHNHATRLRAEEGQPCHRAARTDWESIRAIRATDRGSFHIVCTLCIVGLTAKLRLKPPRVLPRTLRKAGVPTADPKALDADAILAAQTLLLAGPGEQAIVATTNVDHLRRFVDARRWQDIA